MDITAAETEQDGSGIQDVKAPFIEFALEFPDIEDGNHIVGNRPQPHFISHGSKVYIPDETNEFAPPSDGSTVFASHEGIQKIEPSESIELHSVPITATATGDKVALSHGSIDASVVVEEVVGTAGDTGKPQATLLVAEKEYQLKPNEEIDRSQTFDVQYRADEGMKSVSAEGALRIKYHGTARVVSHEDAILCPKHHPGAKHLREIMSKRKPSNGKGVRVSNKTADHPIEIREHESVKGYGLRVLKEGGDS